MEEAEVKKLFQPEYYESVTTNSAEFHARVKNLALYLLECEEAKTETERKQFYFLLEQLLKDKIEKINLRVIICNENKSFISKHKRNHKRKSKLFGLNQMFRG